MIASRFRSVGWVAGVAVAALGFYMVSLRVAAERGKLEDVDKQIAVTRHEIKELQTELGTRSRLVQLERWNKDVLALTAPKAEQYLNGAAQLASFQQPVQPAAVAAPVQQASVEVAPEAPKVIEAAYHPAETPHVTKAAPKPAKASVKLAAKDDAKPARAKASAKASAKPATKLAQAGVKAKAAAAKLVDQARKAKPLAAKIIETAYTPKHKDAATKAKPAVHSAPFTRPAEDRVSQSPIRTVALLDDHLLGQIGRAASAERGSKKNR